jgi:hypothetical protein
VGSRAEYGSVIKPGPDWARGDCPLNAVIVLLDQATGGYRSRSEEQHFRHLLLSGSALPAYRLDDDGAGQLTPRQAIRVTGGSRAVFAGCYLQGRKHAWQADRSSSTTYDRTTTWAKGPTSAPVIVTGPRLA